jgi:hypothetical protein
MINIIFKIFLIIGFLFLTGCNYSDYDHTGTETIQDRAGNTLTMYVYDSGFIVPILDGIATIFDSNSGIMSLFGIGILFSLIIMMIKGALTGKYDIMSFLAGLFLFSIMFVPKVNVAIEEYNSLNIQTVANVPWGAAVVGTFSTNIGKSLTNLYNQHFTVPNMYETGFVSPLKIITDIIDLGAVDTIDANGIGTYDENTYNPSKINNFTLSLNNYMRDCVIKDMYADTDDNSNRVITREKISKSPDTWAALKVPHDGITWNTTIYFNPQNPLEDSYIPYVVTCAEAYDGTQDQTIYGNTSAGSPTKGLSYFMTTPSSGSSPGPLYDTLLKKLYLSYKPNAAQTLIGSDLTDLNSTIANLFSNQANAYAFMKNSYAKWAFEKSMAETSSSTLVTYQAIKQRQIQLASERSLFAEMALPTAAFLQALIFFAAPIVAFAMLLGPMGIGLAGKYLQLAIWVSTWDVMMSVINLFTFTSFQKKIAEMLTEISNNSMPSSSIASFDNIEKIYTEANSFLAVASNLAAATPIITYALLTGTAYSLVSAINRVTSSGDYTNEKLAAPDLVKGDAGNYQAGGKGAQMALNNTLGNRYSVADIPLSGDTATIASNNSAVNAQGFGNSYSIDHKDGLTQSTTSSAQALTAVSSALQNAGSRGTGSDRTSNVASSQQRSSGQGAAQTAGSTNASGSQTNIGIGVGASGEPFSAGKTPTTNGAPIMPSSNPVGASLDTPSIFRNKDYAQRVGAATAGSGVLSTPGGAQLLSGARDMMLQSPEVSQAIFGTSSPTPSQFQAKALELSDKIQSGKGTDKDAAALGTIVGFGQEAESNNLTKEDDKGFKDVVADMFNDAKNDIKQSYEDMKNPNLDASVRALAAADFLSNFIGGPAGIGGKFALKMVAKNLNPKKAYDTAQRILKNENSTAQEKSVAEALLKSKDISAKDPDRKTILEASQAYKSARDADSGSLSKSNKGNMERYNKNNPSNETAGGSGVKNLPANAKALAGKAAGLINLSGSGSFGLNSISSDSNGNTITNSDSIVSNITGSSGVKLSETNLRQVQASQQVQTTRQNSLITQNVATQSLDRTESTNAGARAELSNSNSLSFNNVSSGSVVKDQAIIGLMAYNYEQAGQTPQNALRLAVQDYNENTPNATNAGNIIKDMNNRDYSKIANFAQKANNSKAFEQYAKNDFNQAIRDLSDNTKEKMLRNISQISGFNNEAFESELNKWKNSGDLSVKSPEELLKSSKSIQGMVQSNINGVNPMSAYASGIPFASQMFTPKTSPLPGVNTDIKIGSNGEQVGQKEIDAAKNKMNIKMPNAGSISFNGNEASKFINGIDNSMRGQNNGIDYNSMFNAKGMVSHQNEGGVYMSSNAASRALQLSMVGTALTAKEKGTASDEFIQGMLKDAANVNTNVSAPKLDSNDSPAQQAYKIMQSGFNDLAYEESMKKTKDNAYSILSKSEERVQPKTGEDANKIIEQNPASAGSSVLKPTGSDNNVMPSVIPTTGSNGNTHTVATNDSNNNVMPSVIPTTGSNGNTHTVATNDSNSLNTGDSQIKKSDNGLGDGYATRLTVGDNGSVNYEKININTGEVTPLMKPSDISKPQETVEAIKAYRENEFNSLNSSNPLENALSEAQKKNEEGRFVNPLPRKDEEDIQSNRISNLTFDSYSGTMTANGAPLGFGNKIKLNNEEHYEQTKTTFNPSQVTNEIDIGVNDTADPIKSVEINGQWHMVVEENGVYTKINLKDNG